MTEHDLTTACVDSHFFDSGSFSLWTRAAEYAKEHGVDQWAFYDTAEFWRYMEDYVEFVNTYKDAIDFYANVDVIPNAKLSWRNLKWLEERGLTPVPVVHFRSKTKVLRRYLDHGYKFIALGGLVGSTSQDECVHWLDECFDIVCNNKQRLPTVKIHGFGVTSYQLMTRYPWWSVDSTSWTKLGAFGQIMVPKRRRNKWILSTTNPREYPYQMVMSMDSPLTKTDGAHYLNVNPALQRLVRDWLEEINIPLGKVGPNGEVLEIGVVTNHVERRAANLLFFNRLCDAMPAWPQPFHMTRRGFGLL